MLVCIHRSAGLSKPYVFIFDKLFFSALTQSYNKDFDTCNIAWSFLATKNNRCKFGDISCYFTNFLQFWHRPRVLLPTFQPCAHMWTIIHILRREKNQDNQYQIYFLFRCFNIIIISCFPFDLINYGNFL